MLDRILDVLEAPRVRDLGWCMLLWWLRAPLALLLLGLATILRLLLAILRLLVAVLRLLSVPLLTLAVLWLPVACFA